MEDSLSATSLSWGATLTLLPSRPAAMVTVIPSGNMIRSMRRLPSMDFVVSATQCLLSWRGPDSDGIPVKRSRRQLGFILAFGGWPDARRDRAIFRPAPAYP